MKRRYITPQQKVVYLGIEGEMLEDIYFKPSEEGNADKVKGETIWSDDETSSTSTGTSTGSKSIWDEQW